MERLNDRSDDYVLDAETLQEILHFYSRREELDKGMEIVEGLLSRLTNIIAITADEIRAALSLMSGTRDLTARDAIHAAVVLEYDLEGIVSADRGYDRIPGLTRFDPIALAAQ